jgi:hypothetical protein
MSMMIKSAGTLDAALQQWNIYFVNLIRNPQTASFIFLNSIILLTSRCVVQIQELFDSIPVSPSFSSILADAVTLRRTMLKILKGMQMPVDSFSGKSNPQASVQRSFASMMTFKLDRCCYYSDEIFTQSSEKIN